MAAARLAGLAIVIGFCGAALAAGTSAPAADTPAQAESGTVTITGTRDPAMRSYRSVARGLDAFDEHRHLAPNAVLRFRFAHKDTVLASGSVANKLEGGRPVTAADGLALKLVGDNLSIPIPVDADGRFTIERSRAAHDADATFILNRKNGRFTYLPEVRTPGLPENVRRLGDLRLECFVAQAVVKDEMSFVTKAIFTTVFRTSDWCGKHKSVMGMPAYGQLLRVTIRNGGGLGQFSFDRTSYSAPIGPGSFSDDALIELDYAPQAAVSASTVN